MKAHIQKQDFRIRCQTCAQSTEPGWLCIGRGDWVQCPDCVGGFISGVETRIEPTRKIFLPERST